MVLLVSFEALFFRANGCPNGRDHQSCCPDANAYEESDGVEFCYVSHFDCSQFGLDCNLFLAWHELKYGAAIEIMTTAGSKPSWSCALRS